MPLRELEDTAGEMWRVWDTIPETTSGLTPSYHGGWLTFDNGSERRRLAPVPRDWVHMSDDRLRLLLRASERQGRAERVEAERVEAERRSGERREAERRAGERRAQRPDPT